MKRSGEIFTTARDRLGEMWKHLLTEDPNKCFVAYFNISSLNTIEFAPYYSNDLTNQKMIELCNARNKYDSDEEKGKVFSLILSFDDVPGVHGGDLVINPRQALLIDFNCLENRSSQQCDELLGCATEVAQHISRIRNSRYLLSLFPPSLNISLLH